MTSHQMVFVPPIWQLGHVRKGAHVFAEPPYFEPQAPSAGRKTDVFGGCEAGPPPCTLASAPLPMGPPEAILCWGFTRGCSVLLCHIWGAGFQILSPSTSQMDPCWRTTNIRMNFGLHWCSIEDSSNSKGGSCVVINLNCGTCDAHARRMNVNSISVVVQSLFVHKYNMTAKGTRMSTTHAQTAHVADDRK